MKHWNDKIRTIFINLDTRLQLVIIGTLVGLCSGIAAVGLNYGLEKLSHLTAHFHGGVYVVLFPMAGITLTVLILKYIIHDFGGHGVPEVLYSVSIKGGALKFRSSFSKLVGSLITISSGGSAGPEAPVVISGAAIGSNISGYFKSNEKMRVAVTGSGAAAAIASIFNAPITGIIFTMEVILGEWTSRDMLPVAISSVTGTIVSRLLKGNQIPFTHREFDVNINDIFATVGLAAAITLFSLVGMAGMLSGTLQAPLSGIFLIVEITGGYDAILPLLLVSFFTSTLVKLVEKHSIYHYEMVKRGFLLRPRTDGRILSEIQPAELLESGLITLHPEMKLKDLIPLIKKSRRNYFPVENKNNGSFLGLISKATILDHYRKELKAQTEE